MKIVFLSRMLNHHQQAFSENMLKFCDYKFIATENIEGVGYQKATDANYVVHWYKDEEKELARKLVLEADVVIFGSKPAELIDMRMNQNKLSFIYSERFFKKGTWRRFIPRTYKAVYNGALKYADKNVHILCASAYLPYDLSVLKFPKGRTYKWGYFPEHKIYENVDELIESKTKNSIIWVARLIPLKHPEIIVRVAKMLKDEGYDFELKIVGDGPMRTQLENLISKNKLNDHVHMLGSLKPKEVREVMEKSEIFAFTSNKREGWGAVLNEAMNSACAVVSSDVVGAMPFLIQQGETGYAYKYGSAKDLYEKIKFLLDNPEKRKELAKNAYESIITKWNAEEASKRFIELSSKLLNGESTDLYSDGPCSVAEIIKG